MGRQNKTNQFLYYDPRILKCYEKLKVPANVIIPTTDNGAWVYWTKYRWVYNKLEIALKQRLDCGPIGVEPVKFPVFMKPICNLHGMGVGSKVIQSREDYEKNEHLSGFFWMEYLEGEHLSHDFVVRNGEVVFVLTFKGHRIDHGMFDYWETVEPPQKLLCFLRDFIKNDLKGYTGCMNIETIDNRIIECHLRMGDIDLMGNFQLMQKIIDVYAGKPWAFKKQIPKFYIFALWGEWNVDYKIDEQSVDKICQNLSYEINNPDWQNPPSGVRLAVVAGTNKDACIKARQELCKNFSPKPKKPLS